MKFNVSCYSCFVRQAEQVSRIAGCTPEKQHEVVLAAMNILQHADIDCTPPDLATKIYPEISAIIGNQDPYLEIKRESNQQAMEVLPFVQNLVTESEDPLMAAVRFAIAGNIIDYGASHSFDVDSFMEQCQTIPLAVDHGEKMRQRFSRLGEGDRVLYLHDNCGELVYDRLLLDYLKGLGVKITMVVRGGAIINDATLQDAQDVGLSDYGEVISNGAVCPGTPLTSCSDELLNHFETADLIISKGQGNFESLSGCDYSKILFLLTVKCQTVGRHFAELAGVDETLLPGKGEMAIYFP